MFDFRTRIECRRAISTRATCEKAGTGFSQKEMRQQELTASQAIQISRTML
jgi:hypothetical protein